MGWNTGVDEIDLQPSPRIVFAVAIRMPGDLSWCQRTKTQFDERMPGRAAPWRVDGMSAAVACADGRSELVLTWNVAARSLFQAVKYVGEALYADLPREVGVGTTIDVVAIAGSGAPSQGEGGH
jgi:hypothetical protein